MWVVTYYLNECWRQKIFFSLTRLKSFLENNEKEPKFKLVSVIQAVI